MAGTPGRSALSQALGSRDRARGRVGTPTCSHGLGCPALRLHRGEWKETWETRQPEEQLHGNARRQATSRQEAGATREESCASRDSWEKDAVSRAGTESGQNRLGICINPLNREGKTPSHNLWAALLRGQSHEQSYLPGS